MKRVFLMTLAAVMVALPFAAMLFLASPLAPSTSIAVITPVDPRLLLAAAILVPVINGVALWIYASRLKR